MKIIIISIFIIIDVQLFIMTANGQCIEVFEHQNFRGNKFDVCIESDSKCYKLNNEWNNNISSINTHSRCVLLYENNDCTGSHTRVFSDENGGVHNNLETSHFDDKASSMSLCGYLTQVGWYSLDGFDFWGSDGFYQESNETQCKERCLTDHQCKFILVSSDGTQCWGKYYGDLNVFKDHRRKVMSKNKREFIRQRGERYYGNDIAIIDNINENECKVICSIHPKCTVANFLQIGRKCFIKNMNPIRIGYDPNMIGIRKKDNDYIPLNSINSNSSVFKLLRECCSIDGFDFYGSDGFYQNSNEKQCRERCLNDDKCKFILVSSDDTQCWGKYYGDFNVFMDHRRRAISKYKREFIHERGESYFGDNIIIVNNVNENDCKLICGIHPRCNAANFLQLERKCYIKNLNPIDIHYDQNMIGIREKDWDCKPINSTLMNPNPTFDKRCYITTCNQNGSWIRDLNECQNKSNN
jgi:hypothetical protein